MGDNRIIIGGGIMPTTQDTPGDVRCRVETRDDIAHIDNPYRGMTVYVADEDREYRIRRLSPKTVGGIEVPNAAVDLSDPQAVVDVKEDIVRDAAEKAAGSIASKTEYDEETGTLAIF